MFSVLIAEFVTTLIKRRILNIFLQLTKAQILLKPWSRTLRTFRVIRIILTIVIIKDYIPLNKHYFSKE